MLIHVPATEMPVKVCKRIVKMTPGDFPAQNQFRKRLQSSLFDTYSQKQDTEFGYISKKGDFFGLRPHVWSVQQ